VNRDDIVNGAAELGVDLDTHIAFVARRHARDRGRAGAVSPGLLLVEPSTSDLARSIPWDLLVQIAKSRARRPQRSEHGGGLAGARVLSLWRRCAGLPFGRALFGFLFGRTVPTARPSAPPCWISRPAAHGSRSATAARCATTWARSTPWRSPTWASWRAASP
jgi:hypothetical protein